ncbi:hypothetical protein G6F37_005905 [Rhizopus arrhizus]|nr:hypothetical protein G6F38_008722 [Rhizopus arrhizus]KAG1158318.1 hypothetical protein G6F37_005905 [Rhizopus arrhizus]
MGNMFDEEGDRFVEMKMEVDDINYPLDNVTNFNRYSDLKPPEKMQQDKKEVLEEDLSSSEKKSVQQKDVQKLQERGYGGDFLLDEVAFHINLKRSMAWSKKRKAASGGSVVVGKGKGGTVTCHYFNFIAMTLDVMDKHELFKERYLVMDNAPIHKHTDIRSYIESQGYGCVYLPPYSPEINPIEQFWSVCKSKLKREAILEEETLTSRIKVACNNVLISDLRGFCKYSVTRFSDCLKKRPI